MIRFRPEFLDFRRGIRVGRLEDNERITRILKLALEQRFGEPFVTERYGRGMYWRWIGFVPRSNRAAKPVSSNVSFGCSKFYVMMDTQEQLFSCGMQVERGYVRAPAGRRGFVLRDDWDWHRLLRSLRPRGSMGHQLKRLVLKEGFKVHAGTWEDPAVYGAGSLPTMAVIRRRLEGAAKNQWAGFQVFYPMTEEARVSTGVDLIESMLAVFDEVTPPMNLCMQTKLKRRQ